MVKSDGLWTVEFIGLNAIGFFTYCNIAIFFEFHDYLETLGIPSDQIGFLIALFSIAALVSRPLISPFISDGNASKWMLAGCCSVIGSLALYNFSTSFWAMAITRAIHGATYVVLGTAATTKLVSIIPKDKSAQAFGMFSVVSLAPFAIVPPLLKPMNELLGGFNQAINVSAALMLINLPIIGFFRNRDRQNPGIRRRFRIRDIALNLHDPRVWSLLLVNLVVWTSFTTIFFYLRGFGDQIGVSNPGLFFTISTFTEIGVRVFAGQMFDRGNKKMLLIVSSLVLVISYLLIGMISGSRSFFVLGLVFGLGWGIIFPVINGSLYDVSSPEFRGLNANLATEMFQLGFSLGPLAGGIILGHYGYFNLFAISGLFLLTVVPLVTLTNRKRYKVNVTA